SRLKNRAMKNRARHEFSGKSCLARISEKSVPGTDFGRHGFRYRLLRAAKARQHGFDERAERGRDEEAAETLQPAREALPRVHDSAREARREREAGRADRPE